MKLEKKECAELYDTRAPAGAALGTSSLRANKDLESLRRFKEIRGTASPSLGSFASLN